jgi:excinuclease ABC subunit B
MRRAIDEMDRRRTKQVAYNKKHGITPTTIHKTREEILQATMAAGEAAKQSPLPPSDDPPWEDLLAGDLPPEKMVTMLYREMESAAERLEFEKAASLRDRIEELRAQWGLPAIEG